MISSSSTYGRKKILPRLNIDVYTESLLNRYKHREMGQKLCKDTTARMKKEKGRQEGKGKKRHNSICSEREIA